MTNRARSCMFNVTSQIGKAASAFSGPTVNWCPKGRSAVQREHHIRMALNSDAGARIIDIYCA